MSEQEQDLETKGPDSQSRNIGNRMFKGAAWMVLLRFSMRGLGLLSIVILARLLIPEDFGVATLAAMSVGLLEAMGEFRPDLALIRQKNAERQHYDTVWTLAIIRGTIMAIILAAGAHAYAQFFGEPRLEVILYIFAAMSFVEGFRNVGVVDFFKNMELHKEFRLMFASRASGFIATVAIAIIWRNYWALVLGMVTGRVVPIILSYTMHSYRPRISLAAWRQIAGFAGWVMLNNILMYVYNRADTFVIGKLVGAAPLGFYSVARRIGTLPSSELVGPIRQAIFPGYAKLVGDEEKMRRGFLDAFSIILMITVPICVGMAMTSTPLVAVMLGEKWLESVPLLQILIVFGLLTVGRANAAPIFLALGKPHTLAAITGISAVVVVPLLIWAVARDGAYGAAWAMTGGAALILLLSLTMVARLLVLPVRDIFLSIWRVLVATATMTIALWLLQMVIPEAEGLVESAVILIASAVVGAAVYVGTILPLWRLSGSPDSGESHVVLAVRAKLGRTPPAPA